LGRQTTRNPECLDAPPLRGSVNGFVWGYCLPPAVRKTGWMQLADLKADLALERLACGPADADFDRRRPQACAGHCDGRALRNVRDASGQAVVAAREVYLRYAPGSTAFRYLVRGDTVRRLLRSNKQAMDGSRDPDGALGETRHPGLGVLQRGPIRRRLTRRALRLAPVGVPSCPDAHTTCRSPVLQCDEIASPVRLLTQFTEGCRETAPSAGVLTPRFLEIRMP